MLRTIILVVIATAFGSGVANAQQKVEIKGLSAKVKLNQAVSGYLSELNGKYQLRVSELTFEPSGSVGPHHHAGPGIVCVTAGELTNVLADGKTTIYKPGECFYGSGDVSHSVRNATDKPVVVLQFEILQASLSGGSIMPVPAPK
jgi:quercetin dioxygenase-like cupin family protein